jgi:hypothetical protein
MYNMINNMSPAAWCAIYAAKNKSYWGRARTLEFIRGMGVNPRLYWLACRLQVESRLEAGRGIL